MSFSNESEYKTHLQVIREIYRPESSLFIIQNRYDDNEIYITFNTQYNFKTPGIIKINKKRETNTLFSVDAVKGDYKIIKILILQTFYSVCQLCYFNAVSFFREQVGFI